VSVRFGRFGAFAQIGTRDDEEKPKFASLRPHQRMDEITLADALELFKLPRTLGEWDDGHLDQGRRRALRPIRAVRHQEIRVAQE
jgi:DNA topoisomerase-1